MLSKYWDTTELQIILDITSDGGNNDQNVHLKHDIKCKNTKNLGSYIYNSTNNWVVKYYYITHNK